MLDPASIAAFLDGAGGEEDISVENWDQDGDGTLTPDDCPYPKGSHGARAWWYKVFRPYCLEQVTEEMREQYGDKLIGSFDGKPMVPGEPGTLQNPQGDWDYLVAKIRVTEGLSQDAAEKVAGSIKQKLYG
jgi:hypothetical protein